MKAGFVRRLLVSIAISLSPSILLAYTMPVGIPDTAFGVHEAVPQRPPSWDAEIAGFYYVNPDSPNASDSNRYGTPSSPRASLPNPIPAGAYVELAGTYSRTVGGATRLVSAGTESNPAWLVGDHDNTPTFTALTTFQGTYLVVDGVNFNNRVAAKSNAVSHHIAIRNSDIHKHLETTPGALVGLSGSSGYVVHDIVIYNNAIHDSRDDWNVAGSTDIDAHGIKAHDNADNIWILSNRFYNLGGNAVQVGDQNSNQNTIYNIFVGGNEIHNTRQTGIGVKKASDVVISENTIHGLHEIQTGNFPGGIGYQYGPRRVWILSNTIYDCDKGIGSGSDTSPAEDYIYIVGNLIYDIAAAGKYKDDGWSPGSAIVINGGRHIEIVGNTITNAEQGIATALQGAVINIENNIIYNMTESTHIHMNYSASTSISHVRNNLFYQPGSDPTFRWAGTLYADLDGFQSSGSNVAGNIGASPDFLDESRDIYRLGPTSAAIDRGLSNADLSTDLYSGFVSRYGLNINLTRVEGQLWDMGAFEYSSSLVAPPSPPTLSVD